MSLSSLYSSPQTLYSQGCDVNALSSRFFTLVIITFMLFPPRRRWQSTSTTATDNPTAPTTALPSTACAPTFVCRRPRPTSRPVKWPAPARTAWCSCPMGWPARVKVRTVSFFPRNLLHCSLDPPCHVVPLSMCTRACLYRSVKGFNSIFHLVFSLFSFIVSGMWMFYVAWNLFWWRFCHF